MRNYYMTHNMSAAHLKWTQMLLFLGGVLSTKWDVIYQHQNICAARGSSVSIPCSFEYPKKETIVSVMWGHERNNIYDGPFLYDSRHENTSSRFQYTGDKNHTCSLKILHVQNNDTGLYAFRFITTKDMFTGLGGSKLKVFDLRVLTTNENTTIKEGDSMNLSCVYSCDGNFSSEFTWVKDERDIHEGRVLSLRNMSSTHSGNYVCSLQGHSGTASGVKHIEVEYGPKNTSVSVTPSAETINPGSNITLICSSHANPPVENYAWFKIHNNIIQPVGDKPEHHIRKIHPSDRGHYFCSATNKHGSQNSSVVTLKVKEVKVTFNRDIVIIATFATTLLALIVLVSIRRMFKKKSKVSKTECEVDTQNPIYANWKIKNQTQEERHEEELVYAQQEEQDEQHEREPVYAAVTINKKTNMVKKMDSPDGDDDDDDDECVIYSAVCRR